VGGWIRTFHNVVHLRLDRHSGDRLASLVPFYGLSPTVRSLCLTSTSNDVFDLVCSFPLLKDLSLVALSPGSDADGWTTPSTSPKLTGSLDLRLIGEIRSATRRLLDLPGGLHFKKITLSCINEDVELTTDLVSKCSGTVPSEVRFLQPLRFCN
jgi:hypothetical protein